MDVDTVRYERCKEIMSDNQSSDSSHCSESKMYEVLSGSVHTIEADNWVVGNGLKFELQGNVVAWFTSWDYFIVIDVAASDKRAKELAKLICRSHII